MKHGGILEINFVSGKVGKDWIIDILADIRAFALKSEMMALSEHLDDAIILAATELERVSQRELVLDGHCDKAGGVSEQSGNE
ncbi:MAG: hypothetical protein JKY31_02035 [Rhodobacteraceae bacterium]|nr:hypothetical protein [Paracoccaceae bacterium]